MQLDLVIHNARLLDPATPGERPHTSSVGIWNGKIVGTGHDVDGHDARQHVDAHGACVMPGFHDTHAHTTSFGLKLSMLDLSGVSGMQALLDAVAAYAANLAPDAWVIGTGYGLGLDLETSPSRALLDIAAQGRPVWLTHFSGHRCVLSTAALTAVGVTSTESSGGRGRIGVDASGTPNGVLEEAAMDLVKDHRGPASIEDLADAIDAATAIYATEGITTFVEAGIGSSGIDHSPAEVAAYQLARETGRLHVRGQLMVHDAVLHTLGAHHDDAIDRGLDLGLRTGFGDGHLEIGAMKIWVDGLGVTIDFEDDPAVLRYSIVAGARAGWQIAAHAMGDAAVALVLDALDEADAAGPNPGCTPAARPHRVEHGAIIRPDQITRLAARGMAVAHQASFLSTFGDLMLSVSDEAQQANGFRCRSLLDAGVVVAGSSDRPVAPGAPLAGVQSMVERVTETGVAFGAHEAVDVRTALAAYTGGGAYAEGRADRSGALTQGFDADLVLLGDDPTTIETSRISSIEVLAALVAGDAVHDDAGLFAEVGDA